VCFYKILSDVCVCVCVYSLMGVCVCVWFVMIEYFQRTCAEAASLLCACLHDEVVVSRILMALLSQK
jgi:hypothetical protein